MLEFSRYPRGDFEGSMPCVECLAEPGSSPGFVLFVAVLVRLDVDGEVVVAGFRLRKAVIFKNPLLIPECLFLFVSDGAEGTSELAAAVDEPAETLVLNRYSLDAQEVGGVDCDCMEPCFGSEDKVVAEMEEVSFCAARATVSSDTPKAWASRRRVSSRSSSVMVGYKHNTRVR